ncbi:hypothetical protein AB833_17955 [Chromatiales bacterium (ex Bugula neritina AB1)]|nr:hypothetical protein AB833_17955 [Chromatiales bacterium (ex Bugula neritina AB1)]
MKSTRMLDIFSGIAFIAIAVAVIWVAIPLGVQEPKKVKFVALSPSYYPRLVCYCLLAIGILLALSRALQRETTEKSVSNEQATTQHNRKALPILLAITAILFLYYWFLLSLGFVVTSTIALLAFMLLAGEKKAWALISIPITVPLLLYFFFTKVANIPIPTGILQPILVGS